MWLSPQNRDFYITAGSNAYFRTSINGHYLILKGELRGQDKFSQSKIFERRGFWVLVLFGWEEGQGQDTTAVIATPPSVPSEKPQTCLIP